jgi:hypothetical protein
MPRVTVSARHIEVPDICVCCGGPPSQSLDAGTVRIYDEQRFRLSGQASGFPICSRCFEHRPIRPKAWPYALAALLMIVPTRFLSVPVAMLVYALVCRRREVRVDSLRSPTCEAVEYMAAYERSHGTEHTFRFDSRRFAQEFAVVNRAAGKRVWADLNAFLPQPRVPLVHKWFLVTLVSA